MKTKTNDTRLDDDRWIYGKLEEETQRRQECRRRTSEPACLGAKETHPHAHTYSPTHTHIYPHTYTHTRTYTHLHTHLPTYTRTYKPTYPRTYTHLHTHAPKPICMHVF